MEPTVPSLIPAPLAPAAAPPDQVLLVAMPALNEAKTVGEVVAGIPRDTWPDLKVQVLVVDDGSTDETAKLARDAGAHVISHPAPRGVGAAFHTALKYAVESGAAALLTIDADGQFDGQDVPKLAEPVLRGGADFATGSRFKDPSLIPPDMPWIKRWGNRRMASLISGLAGQTFYDVSCGMRCYGRRAMFNLNLLGEFTYTQEVILNLAFKRLELAEVPIRVKGQREHGKSRVANNLWRYGFRASAIIFRCYRDYRPLSFFGGIALLFGLIAAAALTFLAVHYVRAGEFTPHKWAGFTGGAFALASLVSLHLGVIGDMLARHRVYLEEVLYRQRAEKADGL